MSEQVIGESFRGRGAGEQAQVFPGRGTRSDEPRTRLFDLSIGLVETVSGNGPGRSLGPEDISRDFQVALPYRGVFVWHVGNDEVVGDPDQVLFVTGGESYRMSQPAAGGYAELIVTPAISMLAEIAGTARVPLRAHPFSASAAGARSPACGPSATVSWRGRAARRATTVWRQRSC